MMFSVNIHTANWFNDDEKAALRYIRRSVFIEEQQVPVELEWDEYDSIATHLLAIDNTTDEPVGTARMFTDNNKTMIGRMAVLPQWRCHGVGTALLQRLLQIATELSYPHIQLSAQTQAIGFYQRFGFRQYGDEFLDAGIPHYHMRLIQQN